MLRILTEASYVPFRVPFSGGMLLSNVLLIGVSLINRCEYPTSIVIDASST